MIAICSNRDWKTFFGWSFFQLGIHLTKKGVDFFPLLLNQASSIPFYRQIAVNTAIEKNCTHILFIDDDMGFKQIAFDYLMSRDKEFVAANYVPKVAGDIPIVRDLQKNPVFSVNKTGIEKVSSTGFGFVLIKTDAIKRIPFPHFETKYIADISGNFESVSEDRYFCRKALEANIDIYVDHDASNNICHIGDFKFVELPK